MKPPFSFWSMQVKRERRQSCGGCFGPFLVGPQALLSRDWEMIEDEGGQVSTEV